MNEWEYSFEPVIGSCYYLYQRTDGSVFLSIIKPSEWGDGYEIKYLNKKVKFTQNNDWVESNDAS
jgi:hypothetical protein